MLAELRRGRPRRPRGAVEVGGVATIGSDPSPSGTSTRPRRRGTARRPARPPSSSPAPRTVRAHRRRSRPIRPASGRRRSRRARRSARGSCGRGPGRWQTDCRPTIPGADRAAQRRPVPIGLQPDDPEPPPVRRRVVVHARVAHRLALADRDRPPGQQERVQVEADGVGALAVQRRADQLPSPVRARATRAALTAAASVMPVRWSPCRPAGTAGCHRAGSAGRPPRSGPRTPRCRRPGGWRPGPSRHSR